MRDEEHPLPRPFDNGGPSPESREQGLRGPGHGGRGQIGRHSSRPDDIEPDVDPDSGKRVAEENPEPAHGADRYDAGTGQGTATNPPLRDGLQERPILDGSTQGPEAEATVPNPHRGQTDPAAVRKQPALNSTSTNRWLIASVIAVVLLTTVLLILFPWSPVWCGIGIVFALAGLLLMLGVRASRIRLRPRLRIEAILLGLVWLVPLAIIVSVIIASADEIW